MERRMVNFAVGRSVRTLFGAYENREPTLNVNGGCFQIVVDDIDSWRLRLFMVRRYVDG